MIKARDSRLALVDLAIEGFISKPPPKGTQIVKLPTFKDPQPVELPAPENPYLIIEEITSLDEEGETNSEDTILEEDTENPVRDKDFEIFYHTHAFVEEGLSPQLTTALVSEDQEVTKVPKGMVIENKLPDLLSLLESHARTTVPEAPVVPRPPTPIPLAFVQTELVEKNGKWTKEGVNELLKRPKLERKLLLSPPK